MVEHGADRSAAPSDGRGGSRVGRAHLVPGLPRSTSGRRAACISDTLITSPSSMSNDCTHAIVIGGGIGGLLAAAAVSPHFARVTVLESDTQQTSPAIRKGVPQGGQ